MVPRQLRSREPPLTHPRVSVVIPTYDREATIARAIESVLAQSVAPADIIVIDDGSTDRTADVVARYPSIRYRRQANAERGAARNAGARLSGGTHVCFLDSDDTYLPDHIERLSEAAEDTTPVAYTRAEYVFDDGSRVPHAGPFPSGNVTRELVRGNFMPLHTALISLHAFHTLGGFSEDRRLSGSEDWELWLRLSVRHPFLHVPHVTASITVHQGRSMNDLTVLERSFPAAIEKALGDPVSRAALTPRRSELRASGALFVALACYRAGLGARARAHLLRAVRLWPPVLLDRRVGATFLKTLVGRRVVERIISATGGRRP